MARIVVYDCEFLTAPGAPQRFWCGPDDPDPLCIQIGAVALSLEDPFRLSPPIGWWVQPMDRDGQVVTVDPLVTRLTGIDDARLARDGLDLASALVRLADFAGEAPLFGWGKDDLLTLAPSLFVRGLLSPLPAHRFRSAVPLLLDAGEAPEVVHGLRSHTICAHYGLQNEGPAHDARADAYSVAKALQHLLISGRLTAAQIAARAGM